MSFALVPAAGLSRRMGRPKLLLPARGSTIIGLLLNSLRQAGVERIVIVIGPGDRELAQAATEAQATFVELKRQTPDMRQTVEAGLLWVEEAWRPKADESWLLAPADHPNMRPDTIRQVLDLPGAAGSIVVPTCGGKRGHPTRFSWRHVEALRALPAEAGLNRLSRDGQIPVIELPVEDTGMLLDVDTPDDYAKLLKSPR